MPLKVFPAVYFSYSTDYPETGDRIQLGNSYQFDAPSPAPDQRIFRLTLKGMTYFLNPNGTINRTTTPGRNLAGLEDFYIEHKRAKEFQLNHPVYGAVTCKFNLPLRIPDPIPEGNGVFPDFQVELIEIP